jgi:hypothetical protein
MDWDDFRVLREVFGKGKSYLYLGKPDILEVVIADAKEVVAISPEKINIKHPILRVIEGLPEETELTYLPEELDCIVNCLPLKLPISFKILARFVPLLKSDGHILVRLELTKEQDSYMEYILKDALRDAGLEEIARVSMEGEKYFLGKRA